MRARTPGRPKLEAARIEKIVDFETLLTTSRDLLYLRDINNLPGFREAGDVRTGDVGARATASRRIMNLLSSQYQGKVVRYINLGKDSQRRIIAANLEVVNPPPSSPEKALEEEEDDPFFRKL
jgi:hypothetical protein